MQGRLKSLILKSSQEAIQLDLPDIPGLSVPGPNAQPQAPPRLVPISAVPTAHTSSCANCASAPARRNLKRNASASEPIVESDDDDFMPPTKQHAHARARVSSSVTGADLRRAMGHPACSKAPSVRCAPSVFNKFIEHLSMPQRKKISDLGFGGLLQLPAEGLECSDLLAFLMDKLNPESMILEVGHEGGLPVNELAVQKVFKLPNGDMDLPSSTEEENTRALVEFRKLVHVERDKDVKCNHLFDLMRKLQLDNALAIRIFFVVAFNKLLFPAVDNNIRGQDAFMTKNWSQFGNMNWCKALVNELRHAAITWRSERKKSIPGCAIFLIVFYLDNLLCRYSIDHLCTPRAKFFHKSVMENIIREDRRTEMGRRHLGTYRNVANTCYHQTASPQNGIPAAADSISSPAFTGTAELRSLISEIPHSPSRNKASNGLKLFDANSSQAIRSIQCGHEPHIACTTPVAVAQDAHEKNELDRAHSDGNLHHSMFNYVSGFAQDELPASSDVATAQQNIRESIFNTTPLQMAPYIDSFAPDIDKLIQELSQAEKNAKLRISEHHVNHVPTVTEDTPVVSIDCIVPAAPEGGCTQPVSPLHEEASSIGRHVGEHSENNVIMGAAPMHSDLGQELHVQTHVSSPASDENTNLNEPMSASTASDSSDDGDDVESYPISEFVNTQDASGYHIRARQRIDRLANVPPRYRSPFKCKTPSPAIDMTNAVVVRRKFSTYPLNQSRRIVIQGPAQLLSCDQIAQSFADGAPLWRTFMSYFVECLRDDEEVYRPKCVGFRVFLLGALGLVLILSSLYAVQELLNHDEERPGSCSYPDLAALIRLGADIGELDVYKVKLFFVPIRSDDRYTVYCLNMVQHRIDVFDSSNEDHEAYQKTIGDTVVPRLNVLFQKLTNGKFRDFSNWKRPIINIIKENEPNDSPFIGMKIMEHWDGHNLHLQQNTVDKPD
ncbi:hypothetical protein EJB05_44634 [Eragrostis curvula]|uniref:Ubiquitin-like protease family profile domain-containing protein n=1 Tax=Eragrostis curvula TaxID=38414 RepID=A0A5J9TK73_9POAL|nr:hypothetical protein EJB05_44634 [Eragrostis curvula]